MIDKTDKKRKPRAGLLLIGSPSFRNLSGPERGTYSERKEKEVKGILSTLDFLDLVFPGIVYDREDAEKAIAAFLSGNVDFLIAEFLSWSPDWSWVRFLRDMPACPMIFVNVAKDKMSFENTLDEDDFIDYLCSGTLVGSLEASGSISRIPREDVRTVIGSREEVTEQIRIYAEAARVRSLLKKAKVGLLSNMNRIMWSTWIDQYDLFAKIGPELQTMSYATYDDAIKDVSDQENKEWCDSMEKRYRMAPDVERSKYEGCVRASLAIKNLAEENGIDIMVYNDVDDAMFKVAGCRAGFYHPWFCNNQSVLVPEADIGAGLITWILQLLSRKHVNFIEPFHIESEYGTFAGGHAGPNDHNDPAWQDNVVIARDVRFAKTKWRFAGAPFAWYRISPGEKTMAQLVEKDGKYKLVCTLVDSLPGDHILATYSHSIFRPRVPVKDLFEKILRIGTTQHFAIVDGDYTAELEAFAEVMHFELYNIK